MNPASGAFGAQLEVGACWGPRTPKRPLTRQRVPFPMLWAVCSRAGWEGVMPPPRSHCGLLGPRVSSRGVGRWPESHPLKASMPWSPDPVTWLLACQRLGRSDGVEV